MPDELPVHISREEIHSLEVPTSFEATGPFEVRLINHSQSVHVHVHLDEDLSRVADIDAGNHYVEGESERSIYVDVDPNGLDGQELLGKLKVASGYGAHTRWIDVIVSEPEHEQESVRVDESLAQPQPEPTDSSLLDRPEIPVLVLGAIALLVAALTAIIIEDTLVLLGSLVVLGGVIAALFFLMR